MFQEEMMFQMSVTAEAFNQGEEYSRQEEKQMRTAQQWHETA